METKAKLVMASQLLNSVLDDFKDAPEKIAIVELINAVRRLNVKYFDWCTEIDDENGEPHGTTYENGISLEYYIEADEMHNLSKILRKLQ